jgi:hypothetical protein
MWRNEVVGSVLNNSSANGSVVTSDHLYVGWLNLIKICRLH